jgi:hypothetical protein
MPVISRLPMGGGGSSAFIDFPLSIQDAQPTALREGHIWIKSSTLASQITSIQILEAINAGVSNGTLMFIVGDLAYYNLSISESTNLTTGEPTSLTIANNTGVSTTGSWLVSKDIGDMTNSMYINRPLVYSKVGGILDIETAYLWDGVQWILLTQKGSYVSLAPFGTAKIYNFYNDILTLNTSYTIASNNTGKLTGDGTYLLTNTTVYKRTGDVFDLYFTLPLSVLTAESVSVSVTNPSISKDGQTLVMSVSTATYVGFAVYKNNGTTFVLDQVVANATGTGYTRAFVSNTGNAIALAYRANGNTTYRYVELYIKGSDGKFPTTYTSNLMGMYTESSTTRVAEVIFSSSDNYFTVSLSTSTPSYIMYSYQIDYVNKTVNLVHNLSSGNNNSISHSGFVGDVLVYTYAPAASYRRAVNLAIPSNTWTVTFPSGIQGGYSALYFVTNLDSTRAIAFNSSSFYVYSVNIDYSNRTITFTQISTMTAGGTVYSERAFGISPA